MLWARDNLGCSSCVLNCRNFRYSTYAFLSLPSTWVIFGVFASCVVYLQARMESEAVMKAYGLWDDTQNVSLHSYALSDEQMKFCMLQGLVDPWAFLQGFWLILAPKVVYADQKGLVYFSPYGFPPFS